MRQPFSPGPEIKRHITLDGVAGIALFVLAAALAWEAGKLPMGSLADPGPGFLPLALAIALAAFAILIFAFDRTSRPWSELEWPEAPRALGILAATAFAAYALERLGYRLAIFLVGAFLLLGLERKGLLASLIGSLALSFGTYYLFSTLLKVPLPLGPWGF
jgi:putative tricarboxylic transport membrane protein